MPLRVRTVFTGVAGTPWYSNLYFGDTSLPADAHAAVVDFWALIGPYIHTSVDWTVESEVTVLSILTGQPTSQTSVGAISGGGTASGQPLPWATQGLLRARTEAYANGRNVRGRIFIPGLTEDAQSQGRPEPAVGPLMVTAAEQLLLTDATWVVWSRKNQIQPEVTSVDFWQEWAVLRSRRD